MIQRNRHNPSKNLPGPGGNFRRAARVFCSFLPTILLALTAGACTAAIPAPDSLGPAKPPTLTAKPSSIPSATAPPPASPPPPTAAASASPFPDTPVPTGEICAPLEGVSLIQVTKAVQNPFAPPKTGSDDPHQGVDFAQLQPGSGIALPGLRVNAVLSGDVAAVIHARFPYGNALLVETSLDSLPPEWIEQLSLPTPAPAGPIQSALTCPDAGDASWDESSRALYLLYAHLLEPPDFTVGEQIGCGRQIGKIGDSGNALNPHLHLEARVGPAGAVFPGMAHYDASASPAEMANYCTWRVGGRFQLVDPMLLLSLQP